MPLKTETRILEGNPNLELTVSQLPALEAFDLLVTVGKVLGPTFLELPSMAEGQDENSMDTAFLAPILEGLFGRMDAGTGRKIIKESLSRSTIKVDGKPAIPLNSTEQINMIFAGRFQDMLLATRIALEVNYGNFTDIFTAVAGLQKGEFLSSMKKSVTSGPSGDSGKTAG